MNNTQVQNDGAPVRLAEKPDFWAECCDFEPKKPHQANRCDYGAAGVTSPPTPLPAPVTPYPHQEPWCHLTDASNESYVLSHCLPSESTNAPRNSAAQHIRQARATGDTPLSFRLRDSFRERAAICEFDGGLSRAEAERIAADEIQSIAATWNSPVVATSPANGPATAEPSPAADWLTQALSNGPRTGNYIFEQAGEAGFSRFQIDSAMEDAGVTVTFFAKPTKDQLRSGIRGNGGLWELRGWEPSESRA